MPPYVSFFFLCVSFYRAINKCRPCACGPSETLGKDKVVAVASHILGLTNDFPLIKFEIQIVELVLAFAS